MHNIWPRYCMAAYFSEKCHEFQPNVWQVRLKCAVENCGQKSVKFGIGFLVTKCLNVLQKSPKDCTSMYFTRPNQIPNTTPFGILHWIVYNWHKCQIEGSLRHLRCCIPQILLHCAQCYSQKANVVRASKYRTKYHHHRHHGSRYLSVLRWPSHFLLVKSFSLQNLCC